MTFSWAVIVTVFQMRYLKASQVAFLLLSSLYLGVFSFCHRAQPQCLPLHDAFVGWVVGYLPWAVTHISRAPCNCPHVPAAREVHQPAPDEFQRHGNEEGGAAHGAWCLHRVPASEAGERREETHYRYLLRNQLFEIQQSQSAA